MSNVNRNIKSKITVLPRIDVESSTRGSGEKKVFGHNKILTRIGKDNEDNKLHVNIEISTLDNKLIQSSQSPITNIEFITPSDNFFGESFGEINEESSGDGNGDGDSDGDGESSEFEGVNIAIAPKEYSTTQPYSERGPTRITVNDNNSILSEPALLSVRAIQTNNVENPLLENLSFEEQQNVESDQRVFSLSFTPPPLLDRLIDGTIEYEVSYNINVNDPSLRTRNPSLISGVIGTITQSIKAYEKPEETEKAEQEDFGNPSTQLVIDTVKSGLKKFLINTLDDTPPDINNVEIVQPESERYFKYAINDDSGLFKPILNWVQGGELSQVNNEIDVLDSIVLKFADPVSQQLSRLDTVAIYNSRINGLQYKIDYSEDIADEDRISLRPNFKTEILTDKVNQVSRSKNFKTITESAVTDDIIDYFKSKEKVELNVDYTDFNNFIKFSSAEERIRNFIYNVQAIETLDSASAAIDDYDISAQSKQLEKTKLTTQKREIVNRFDAYDSFLYTDSGSIYESLFVSSSEQIPASWPKESDSTLKLSTDSEVKSWVTSIIEIAKDYDNLNRDSFRNNTPEFIREDLDSSDYILFVDMIGQLFDFVYLHVNELSKLYEWTDDITKGLSSDLSFIMLSAFIAEIDVGFSDKDIWEYIIGAAKSGEDISSNEGLDTKFSFERQQKNTIRRLLTNLPYLLKHKGTRAGIKGLVKSYGIPESTLSITEFGNIQTDEGVEENSNTIITNTFKLEIPKSSNKNIFFNDELIPHVKAIEFNYQWDKTDSQPNEVTFMSGTNPDSSDENFNIKLVPTTDTLGHIQLTINSGSVSTEISSSEAPIFNENFWNVLVQQSSDATYQIYLNDFNRQLRTFNTKTFDATFIDKTEALGFDPAFNNSYDMFVGNDGTANTFYGYLDELRIWSEPLSQTDFDEHTKFPSSVRLDDPLKIPSALKVRVDIDKEPSNDSINNNTLPNLVFNPAYETNVSSSNLQSSDFKSVQRDDIALSPVIGTEKQTDNKVRYQVSNGLLSGTLTVPVNNNSTSAESLPDTTDTNDVVIGFSPTQIVDQIILQHFGSTDLIDKYGNPTEADEEDYNALTTFVENFFRNIESNYKVKFLIEYIKNFDKTLFNNIEKFVPEKANLSTSIFIEPHVLDRSKAKKIGNISELIDLANQGNSADAGPKDATLDGDIDTSKEQGNISVIDPTERLIGKLLNITIGNNASLIISADEIDSLLNQSTRIILLKDGFIEQLLENIRPVDALDGELVFRVRNKFNEVFVFEFRKFDFTLKIEELISQLGNLRDGTEEYDILAAQIKQLRKLNQNLFLIKYPFNGDKPGIPATFEDFAELVRTIIGEGAIVGDTIVINGRTYAVDPDGDSVVETFENDGVACIKIEERSDGVSLTVE